jgi:hypothetical protein
MVSVVSVKITRKSPTRKRFASTPTNAFTLLACDDALSAYCLIFEIGQNRNVMPTWLG